MGITTLGKLKHIPLAPEPNPFEVEMAIENLKMHNSPGTDQIAAELIKAGSSTVCSEI
jgi:hypothetical protein